MKFLSLINGLILILNILIIFKEKDCSYEFYSGADVEGRYLTETKFIGLNRETNEHVLQAKTFVPFVKTLIIDSQKYSDLNFEKLDRWYVTSAEVCVDHGYHVKFFVENSTNAIFTATTF